MLIIYDSENIYAGLKGETEDSLEDHVRKGFPELIAAYELGSIKTAIIDDTVDLASLTVDAGNVREMTQDEIAAAAASAPDPEIEAQIQDEIRAIAIESLTGKGAITAEKAASMMKPTKTIR